MAKYLFFGAHPDDPDEYFGGTAMKLSAGGHAVRFVSLTNGDRGHQLLSPGDLAARRYEETQRAARFSGVEKYIVLPNHDTQLVPSLENRHAVIRMIREFAPDVVITHRACDYHPDHRAAAQIVMDAAFLIGVPHCCPEIPPPAQTPIFCTAYDPFMHPAPFRPDAVSDITDILDRKADLLLCHDSQFMEWLPWIDLNLKDFDKTELSPEARRQFLKDNYYLARFRDAAKQAEELAVRYCGHPVEYAETFEISEYGRPVSQDEFQQWMEGKIK